MKFLGLPAAMLALFTLLGILGYGPPWFTARDGVALAQDVRNIQNEIRQIGRAQLTSEFRYWQTQLMVAEDALRANPEDRAASILRATALTAMQNIAATLGSIPVSQ